MDKNDLQNLFKKRMVELLDKHTLDSYRVRTNNLMTILKELSYVLDSWVNGNVKRLETVELCISECIDLLKDDTLENRELFISALEDYLSKSRNKKDEPLIEDTIKMKFWTDELFEKNQDRYLVNLLENMEGVLFDDKEYDEESFIPALKSLDKLISAFACELLRIGYSKVYLYWYFKALLKNRQGKTFQNSFNGMKEKFSNREKIHFTVVISLEFGSKKAAINANHIEELKNEIPNNLRDVANLQNEIKNPMGNFKFFCEEIEDLDAHSASVKVNDNLQKILDFQQEHIINLKPHYGAVVIQEKGGHYIITKESFNILDTGAEFMKEEIATLQQKLRTLNDSEYVDKDVKDRLSASLRHLRIGDSQADIDQQFINYWIALEFIFASSSRNDNTYKRIKENLVRIMTTCYIKRNILYIKNWCEKKNLLNNEEDILEKIKNDDFLNSVNDKLLWYRLKNLKSHVREESSIKEYIKAHSINLLRHLSRIYRLRNELVHEAAIKQDIVNVTSNLRFYLVFVINQMVGYFSDNDQYIKRKSMLSFFWTYEKYEASIAKTNGVDNKLKVIDNIKIFKSCII